MNKIYSNWKDFPMSEWRWPSFSPEEIACRGTGRLMIDPRAMGMLQALRTKIGKPMIVNSGYRSPEHNKAVGGALNSKHMQGLAFDVRMENHNPADYLAAAVAVGFEGIGTYPRANFIHVDARTSGAATWGDPFPPRKATPHFAEEKPLPPQAVSEDTEAKSAIVGIGGAVAASGGVISAIGSLDPLVQALAIGGLLVSIAALVWIFRKRLARMAT
jgi:hypothetical protein